MKALYLDCFSGISGNMMLGALLSLGVPQDYLLTELRKLNISGYEIIIEDVSKNGISAKYVDVKLHNHSHQGAECGHSANHEHRHLHDIIKIIDASALSERVKANSKKCFLLLAQAEAKVHGTTVDTVHFHEVGAVDTIIDIVGTAIGLDYLDIAAVYNSRVRTGTGFIKISHGIVPVPAPATAELLNGFNFYHGTIEKELVTPTGAALLKTFSCASPDIPEGFISAKIGCGAGTWDIEIPNILRVFIGEIDSSSARTVVLETNIDDLNPQFFAPVIDKLLAAGALDVWLTPVVMKKGRPAHKLSVLVDEDMRKVVENIIFSETTTIGLRYYSVQRSVLQREMKKIDTCWGQAKVKLAYLDGKIINIYPEFDDIKLIALKHSLPLKQVWDQVYTKAIGLFYEQ